jgi:AAA domain
MHLAAKSTPARCVRLVPDTASLSIRLDDKAPDGFVVHSFAGDDPIRCRDYVREKAGLPGFKPNGGRRSSPQRSARAKIVATYDYTDVDGALLYQVVRLDPKDFRQRRPDGNGGWIWKIDDIGRAPYRLPDIIKYPDATVFVTEGEKDADRVAELGHCATTVACGKWIDDCVKALAGRDVFILEDNDEAGRKKALTAAAALYGMANSIRIVRLPDLPDKGDVSDWLDAHPSRADRLVGICMDTPEWKPSDSAENSAPTEEKPNEPEPTPLGEWDAGEDTEIPPPRGWLLGNTFCRKFLSSLLADGGVGKTALRYAQILSMVTGRPLTGEHVFQRCRGMIVSLEDDVDELRRRILAARLHHGIDRSELKGWLFLSAPGRSAGKLMTADRNGRPEVGHLATYLETTIIARKLDFVTLDPFVKSHSVEENQNSIIDEVAQVLTDLGTKHNIAVDVPHHTSKGAPDPGNAHRGRGASANGRCRAPRLYAKPDER